MSDETTNPPPRKRGAKKTTAQPARARVATTRQLVRPPAVTAAEKLTGQLVVNHRPSVVERITTAQFAMGQLRSVVLREIVDLGLEALEDTLGEERLAEGARAAKAAKAKAARHAPTRF